MLINLNAIVKILNDYNIKITGAFHLGAHECEEIQFYIQYLKLRLNDLLWIEAMPNKVEQALNRHIPNVYNAIITDKDDEDITFNISNNGQSSSVLNMKTHLQEHPHVYYTSQITGKSITIDTFFERNNIDPLKYNFWNFDIQGAELMALKGAVESIQYAKAIYLEVNEKELYENCALIDEIDNFLSSYNFRRVLTNMTQHGWGDALYVKEL
jgi:FkbM family methyltransferase